MDWGKCMPPENPTDDFTPEEIALMAGLSEIARSTTNTDRERVAPPSDIWDAIASQAFDDATVDATEPATSLSHTAPVIDLTNERSSRPDSARTSDGTAPTTVGAEGRSPLLLIAAAIVGLVIIGGAAVAFLSGAANTTIEYATEITNADLPEAYAGTGTAQIDDARTLMIDFDTALPTSEPVELWLIRPDLSDMVSLGIVEPGESSWPVPDGIDPAEYSVVDLSIEPNDGDETHSGRSILRGVLTLNS